MEISAHLEQVLDELNRSVEEAKEHLRITEGEKARLEEYLRAIAYPEGSLAWIKGMLAYISSHPGCKYCSSAVTAFELVPEWEPPTWEELLHMEAKDVEKLTAGIVELNDLLENGGDDASTCSYCQHVLAKD
jgi:hypothetical protein